MRKYGIALGVSVIPFGLAMGSAQAQFINGSISFSDGGITVPTPPPPTSSIVSGLTTVTQGTPAANSCSGSFGAPGCPLLPAATAATFSIPPVPGTVYTYGGFTFTLNSIVGVTRTPLAVSATPGVDIDALALTMNGTVSGAGFQTTGWSGSWTGNGSCPGNATPQCTGTPTASYSVSITATSSIPTSTPEPTSLALLGSALVGFGLVRRRRKAA